MAPSPSLSVPPLVPATSPAARPGPTCHLSTSHSRLGWNEAHSLQTEPPGTVDNKFWVLRSAPTTPPKKKLRMLCVVIGVSSFV